MQDATEETSATTLDERFDVDWEHPLGHGSFGTVYTGVDKKTHEAVAVKEISKALTDNAAFEREMEALWRLRDSGGHPNICGLREHFDDTSTIKQHQRGRGEGGYYYLVLDRVEGCEMFDALIAQGAYSEADAARLIQEAASALDYLHGIHIVHGDLKPENLMLSSHNASDSVIKVVDFGCAQVGTISSSSSNDEGEVAHEEENNEKDDNNYNILGHARRPGLPPNTNSINHKTAVTRTPAYCPPEILEMQCRCDGGSDDGDHRIDSSFDMWVRAVCSLYYRMNQQPCHRHGLKSIYMNDCSRFLTIVFAFLANGSLLALFCKSMN